MSQNKKALYPYTLQPVALEMDAQEFRRAQMALFAQAAQNHTLKSLRPKEWAILGALTLLAVLGLIFVSGYSTIVFWLTLIGVGVYLLLRTLGLKWYTQKEYEKQIAQTQIPDQLTQIKLGVQPHGLILTLPMPESAMPSMRAMRGMAMRAAPSQQAIVKWDAVQGWDETDDFIFVLFEASGQQGSQIIPKRLKDKLPLDTIRKHLQDTRPKGLPTAQTVNS